MKPIIPASELRTIEIRQGAVHAIRLCRALVIANRAAQRESVTCKCVLCVKAIADDQLAAVLNILNARAA